MILSARVYTHSDRIEYDFNTHTGVHSVHFMNHPAAGVSRGSAGTVINALHPYESNLDVKELVEWLSQF